MLQTHTSVGTSWGLRRRGGATLRQFRRCDPRGGAGRNRRGVRPALLCRDAFPAVRDGGGLLVVRGWDADNTIAPLHEVVERGIRVHPHVISKVLQRTDWLEALRELGSAGRLKLRVAREFPPEEAAQAHRLVEAGRLSGRAVIVF
jgi:NADPH:quinone reductase